MDASTLQRRLVACAHATPSPGDDLCASWVEQAFSRLGLGVVLGDAAHLYDSYCHYADTADLRVGMVVAVPRHPFSPQGTRHGHVGLYVGDGTVMDSADGRVRKVPLELWTSAYGLMDEPRWGWLGSIGLT
jgi:cell wall-associated NlpC family hydrolase